MEHLRRIADRWVTSAGVSEGHFRARGIDSRE